MITFINRQLGEDEFIDETYDVKINANFGEIFVDLNSLQDQINALVLGPANATIGAYPIAASGTNTYTGTFADLTYFTGLFINLYNVTENTAASTLNINALGAKAIRIRDYDNTLREARAAELHDEIQLFYDGTQFVVSDMGATENTRSLENNGNKNHFINGNADIWQDGEDFNPIGPGNYGPDMFYVEYAVAANNLRVQKETSDLPPNNKSKSAIKLTYDGTTPDGILRTKVKMSDFGLPLNTTLTWSFWAKVPNGLNFFFSASDGQTKTFTGTGDWEQYDQQFVVTIDEFFIDVIRPNSLASFAGQEVILTQCKIEVGDKPTSFDSKTLMQELRDCRRYYYDPLYLDTDNIAEVAQGQVVLATQAIILFVFPEQMASIPTIVTSGLWDLVGAGGGLTNVTLLGLRNGGLKQFLVRADTAGGLTTNAITTLRRRNDATAKIAFDARL